MVLLFSHSDIWSLRNFLSIPRVCVSPWQSVSHLLYYSRVSSLVTNDIVKLINTLVQFNSSLTRRAN